MSPIPFKTYEEPLQILKNRGLTSNNDEAALHILKHYNYYRLSAYRFPFQDAPDRFQIGTTFNQIWSLYRFDQIFRQFLSEACKVIEVSVKARWAYVLGKKHGSQAYEIPDIFNDQSFYQKNLARLDKELERSREVFVSHFRKNYNMSRPPIWAVCEIMSFGLLSRYYDNIACNSTKKEIAQTYNLAVGGLRSLLQQAVYIRNLCAHHSRLWNRKLTVQVSLPKRHSASIISSLNFQSSKRIYNPLVLLGYMVNLITPTSDWKQRLYLHLETLNRPNHAEMGFPDDWRERNFWKEVT